MFLAIRSIDRTHNVVLLSGQRLVNGGSLLVMATRLKINQLFARSGSAIDD